MNVLPYLGRLRIINGRDESVNIIGDRTGLITMLQNPSAGTREELNKRVLACYSGASYADCNWQKVITAWGDTPERVTIHGIFASKYPYLSQLNLDQGLITHLPEFMEFLAHGPNLDYAAVREGLRQHLGVKTVYRGMCLTEAEADRVKLHGIESGFFRCAKTMPSVIEEFEANVLSAYFSAVVEAHFHNENERSPLISVSSHEDVAIAVGRHYGMRFPVDASKELYLFKLQVPEIDLIYYTEHGVRTPYKLQDLISHGTHLHASVNERASSYPWDRDAESYIMYKINPGEIVDVSKPNVRISSWNGRVTH